MRTSLMRFRVVFAVFSALFFIGAFLFPQYVQAVDVSNWNELKNKIAPDEGAGPSGELEIEIKKDFSLEGLITIPNDSGLTKLIINGNDHTLNGEDTYGFLKILRDGEQLTDGFLIELNNININNCKSEQGSVIFVPFDYQGNVLDKINLKINNSTFDKNEAHTDGGGVINQQCFSCNLSILNSFFTNNIASNEESGDGGAIYQNGNDIHMVINASKFEGNRSMADNSYGGGAIFQDSDPDNFKLATMDISNSNFIDNKALLQGGTIYLSNNTELTINNSLFKSNQAGWEGGAIFQKSENTKLTATDCHFIINTSEINGGAISTGGEIIITGSGDDNDSNIDLPDNDDIRPVKGCLFHLNTADSCGGAIEYSQKLKVEKCVFDTNSSSYGGALYNWEDGDTTIINSKFIRNHAYQGGVINNDENAKITISDSKFIENYAENTDAIFLAEKDSVTSTFEKNTFTGNTVKSTDGWVFTLRGAVTIEDNEFDANTDKKRDMLFADATRYPAASDDDTISGNNYYRGNYLEDKFSKPESGAEIEYSNKIEVELELREVYNNEVLDGNVKITINGTPYPETFAVENGTAHLKIRRSALKDGTNEITAEYVSDEYEYKKDEEGNYVSGYYHYQPATLTFTIRKTTVIYTVTVIDDGNGNASAEPASGEEGDTVTLTAMPKEGYKFKEWQIVESGGGSLDGNIFTIGAGNAEIRAVFEKSEGPQPPVPPRPEPDWPHFFRLNDELPKTGITGTGIVPAEKPASVNYKPVNMELQIPSLNVTSDIVTVPVTDDGYAVAWLGNDAGLLEGSALPGEGISVIAGHNTLNAEEFGPFAAIRQLDEGERFFVMNTKGKLMTFEVYANEKIGSHDTEALRKAALVYDR